MSALIWKYAKDAGFICIFNKLEKDSYLLHPFNREIKGINLIYRYLTHDTIVNQTQQMTAAPQIKLEAPTC